MKLWTIQPITVLDELEQYGVYHTRVDRMNFLDFLPHYDWLCKYLEEKDHKPNDVDYPIWAWHTFCGKRKKPDLRYACHGMKGESLVCIELEVPDDKVLLSDFELWHFVLNNWWLDTEMFNPDFTESQYDHNQEEFDALSSEEQQTKKEESWENIFDVNKKIDNSFIRRGFDIQAIFWELRMDWVIKIQPFTAR